MGHRFKDADVRLPAHDWHALSEILDDVDSRRARRLSSKIRDQASDKVASAPVIVRRIMAGDEFRSRFRGLDVDSMDMDVDVDTTARDFEHTVMTQGLEAALTDDELL